MVGGLIAFFEGKKIKKVEGVPVEEEEVNGDVEKTTQEPSVGKRPEGEKALVGVNGHVVAAGAGAGAAEDGKVPARTREKIRGKHWYERH